MNERPWGSLRAHTFKSVSSNVHLRAGNHGEWASPLRAGWTPAVPFFFPQPPFASGSGDLQCSVLDLLRPLHRIAYYPVWSFCPSRLLYEAEHSHIIGSARSCVCCVSSLYLDDGLASIALVADSVIQAVATATGGYLGDNHTCSRRPLTRVASAACPLGVYYVASLVGHHGLDDLRLLQVWLPRIASTSPCSPDRQVCETADGLGLDCAGRRQPNNIIGVIPHDRRLLRLLYLQSEDIGCLRVA